MTNGESRYDMNVIISEVLKYGVIVSIILIVVGTVLIFVNRPATFPDSLQSLVSTNYGTPSLNLGALVSGLAGWSPSSFLQVGLIVLLATPVVRVGASVVLFAVEHDKKYIAITLFVLTVLLASTFLLGPYEMRANG